MRSQLDGHVPALGYRFLNRWYDVAIAASMREPSWRPRIVRLVAAQRPDLVVDVGCGTGTLSIAMAGALPGARVVGVDVDPSILDLARAKAGADHVEWTEGSALALPLDDGVADVVTTTLVLHHLDRAGKVAALREIRRVLKPGGLLVVGDWGRAQDPAMRAAFLVVQALDGFANTGPNVAGEIPRLVAEAGFGEVDHDLRIRTVFGTFEVVTAR